MSDLMQHSPLGTYYEHCKKGELAYQVCSDDNTPVFFPRAVAPRTGNPNLKWRVSKGLGTVYATTVVHYKNEPPLNVALIDVDEGFRLMSRVEDVDPMQVKIGMRVKVRMHPGDEKLPPYPVFFPLPTGGSPGTGAGGARDAQNHPGPADHPSSGRGR
jgi:uncharacterized OB-fold protein